ncbi:MAG TPA: iron ABC transporter permease [Spirochaetia bacterium]|nr:iron ABC transporter permease [Spirochaetia bacterium]
MHLDQTDLPPAYTGYIRKKILILAAASGGLVIVALVSIWLGSVTVPLPELAKALVGAGTPKWHSIVVDIRLPRVLTAIIIGAGLSLAGVSMQSVLGNPLGSPFTLGVSQAAAFGAALSVMALGTGVIRSGGERVVLLSNPYLTAVSAFLFCLLATGLLIGISKLKRSSPEVMVLAGVALGSLFQAGLMFLQYFADDVQLAAMVFWTFGDAGRTTWHELFLITVTVGAGAVFFLTQAMNYNALDAGTETAVGLGVRVEAVRIGGMLAASLMTAVIVSLVGIIGFIGLVGPHIMRRLVGNDHRFLIPGSALAGAVLLTAADTLARLILIPHVFPVAILTAFLGVPVFLGLILKGYRR